MRNEDFLREVDRELRLDALQRQRLTSFQRLGCLMVVGMGLVGATFVVALTIVVLKLLGVI